MKPRTRRVTNASKIGSSKGEKIKSLPTIVAPPMAVAGGTATKNRSTPLKNTDPGGVPKISSVLLGVTVPLMAAETPAVCPEAATVSEAPASVASVASVAQ